MSELQEYHNQDLTDSIKLLTVKQGKSKEGTDYYYLELTFINGFTKRIFVNSTESFGFLNAFQSLQDYLPMNIKISEAGFDDYSLYLDTITLLEQIKTLEGPRAVDNTLMRHPELKAFLKEHQRKWLNRIEKDLSIGGYKK